MQSSNFYLSDSTFVMFVSKHLKLAPFFIFPSFFFISLHDVTLDVEGRTIGLCWGRRVFQLHIRRRLKNNNNKKLDFEMANNMSVKMAETYLIYPDALAVSNAFEHHVFLQEIQQRGAADTYYGRAIAREFGKEQSTRIKDDPTETAKKIADIAQQENADTYQFNEDDMNEVFASLEAEIEEEYSPAPKEK